MNETPIKVPFMPPELLYGMKTGYMVVISAGLFERRPVFCPCLLQDHDTRSTRPP
jgi:hypothetical protein